MSLPKYLLVKRGLFYRPKSMGYTGFKAGAGRYFETDGRPDDDVYAVHEDLTPMFSASCFQDLQVAKLLEHISQLAGALEGLLPGKLIGENWNLPDDETVSITISFGKLKVARQAVAAITAAGPKAELGTYPMAIPAGIDGLTYRALIVQAMAAFYLSAVPELGEAGALDAAIATWDTEWDCDPQPRTIAQGIEAAGSDLEHWPENC